MKNPLKALILSVCMMGVTACSVDTHYDSVSTYVEVSVTEAARAGETITIFQQFQFDRDLTQISDMSLHEAWISAPAIPDALTEDLEPFTLDILRQFDIRIVPSEEGEEAESMEWLTLNAEDISGEYAQLKETEDYADLRDHLNPYQQFELEMVLVLEPYQMTRYWKDICGYAENCVLKLPLSMYFKMDD